MAGSSKIEWTDATWNPVVGCSNTSPACKRCYAMPLAHRLGANPATPHYAGLTRRVKGRTVWTGKVAEAPDPVWSRPLTWKVPRRVFVNSMGDLFHPAVPLAWQIRAFAIALLCPQHQFQFLTKWPDRLRQMLKAKGMPQMVVSVADRIAGDASLPAPSGQWPPPHMWLGFSAEDQIRFDERWPHMQTVAARGWNVWASLEPLLGPIDIRSALNQGSASLGWVVAGGESGPGARPASPAWARTLQTDCLAWGVPFLFKQWGAFIPVGLLSTVGDAIDRDAPDIALVEDWVMRRVGKKAAGRILDGREHNAMPPLPEPRRIAA